MNRIAFLRALHDGLAGLPEHEIDDILADYYAHFDEGLATGRSEADVAAALGDPKRLARELRAETGLRRWENHHSLGNSAAVLLAFGALAAVDILFLLPLLFVVLLATLVFGLIICVFGVIGIGSLLSLIKLIPFASLFTIVRRAVTGVVFVSLSAGGGMLLLFALNRAVGMLGRYARLHYRLLKPKDFADEAAERRFH